MLSIVIPTYNYFTLPLVKELQQQATSETIDFEIIVLDDASDNLEIRNQNLEINTLDNCSFFVNKKNLGRGQTINKLVSLAKFNLLILLDCDTKPKDHSFIRNYLRFKESSNAKIAFGGIIYSDEKPTPNEMLRWVYGRKRESVSVENRIKNPYKLALTSNLLVEKQVMIENPFHKEITEYGFEDMVLILDLKKNNIEIQHIDNPLYHLKLDTSIDFITKFHSSLKNLKKLSDKEIINHNDSQITKVFHWIKRFKLVALFAFAFTKFEKLMVQNLVSASPSVLVFDLYRLGYFCKINLK